MKSSDRLDMIKAKMFERTHRQHDELHHRELSDKGKLEQQARQDMAAFSRRSVRF